MSQDDLSALLDHIAGKHMTAIGMQQPRARKIPPISAKGDTATLGSG
jgi:hypothetical protein